MPAFKKVVYAGTFDRLHEGHKRLIRKAFELGNQVGIGLSSDEMATRTRPGENILPYEDRKQALMNFIRQEGDAERCQIFKIKTVIGGGDRMEDLEALLVSDEIKVVENAFRINRMRIENGLKRFAIIIIPRVLTKDKEPVSSSRKRLGESFEDKELIY
ncbi:MAG: pantetheine-phosphate adenylyltransferase [Candidatus Thorarchaeota archaeon]|nr:pantetheine-phosphate adenylyltransferase [Candidatus Thorarchaeota archaeon]